MADQFGSQLFVRLTRFETLIHLISHVVSVMLKTLIRGMKKRLKGLNVK